MCTGEVSTDEVIRGKIPGKPISYVEAYYKLTLTYDQKKIRQIHHDFNKQKYNRQTSYHGFYFSMTFSEHINGIASIITCN